MRIAIDLQACQNGSGARGIGRYALNLARAMVARAPQHDIRVVLSSRFPGTVRPIRDAFDGLLPPDRLVVFAGPDRTTATDPANAWRNRAAEIVRAHAIERLQPDLVFIPSLFEGYWDDTVVSVEAGPYLTAVTLHDLIPLTEPEHHMPVAADRDAYYRKLQGLYSSDIILAVSRFVEQEAVRLLDVPRNRIIHTLEGVDEVFRPQAMTATEGFSLEARYGITRPFVLNISPFELRKNIDGMIAGFASLPRALRTAHQLVIVGKLDDYARNAIARRAREEGLAPDDIVLTGRVADDDLARLFSRCALFVFPSLSEGFGLPALEAMACGAAVVASNTTSIPEVVGRDDALFDPREPKSIAETMERFLAHPARLQGLRAFGLERARSFSWDQVADRTIAAFEVAHGNRTRPSAPGHGGRGHAKPRLAFVTATGPAANRTVAYGRAILPDLGTLFDVTVISLDGTKGEDVWIAANFEIRDLDWLAAGSRSFDRILYNVDDAATEPALAALRTAPGIVLLHDSLSADRPGRLDPRGNALAQRDLFAADGFRAMIAAMNAGAPAPRPGVIGAGIAAVATCLVHADVPPCDDGADPTRPGIVVPPLAVAGRASHRAAMRRHIGLADTDRLVVALVSTEAEASLLCGTFRRSPWAAQAAVNLLIHVAHPAAASPGARPGDRTLPGRIRVVYGTLQETYLGLIGAAEAILVSASYAAPARAVIAMDARASARPATVVDVDGLSNSLASLDAALDGVLREDIGAPAPPPEEPLVPARAVAVALGDAMDHIADTPARTRYREILASFPKSVRGVSPSAADIADVVKAIVRNESIGRTAKVLLDVSAWASPGKRARAPAAIRSLLTSIVGAPGTALVEPVYVDGTAFVQAHQYFAKLIGLPFFAVADQRVAVGPGDRIMVLDIAIPADDAYHEALRGAQEVGATLVLLAVEQMVLQRPDLYGEIAALVSAATAELRPTARPVRAAADRRPEMSATVSARVETLAAVRALRARDLSLTLLCLDPRSDLADRVIETCGGTAAWTTTALPGCATAQLARGLAAPPAEADGLLAPQDIRYVVTGHVQGTYSLALINRAVARALEAGFPGRVRLAPVETVPVAHPEHIPDDDRPLIDALVARPQTAPLAEVVISQHYPLLVPDGVHRLALALFAWEESVVPRATIATLKEGFDGVIAPSPFVAKALIDSGLSIPVAAIGQPADTARYRALGEAPRRAGSRPTTFLHVSSCFPRKGVDVLLAAWATAFTRSDDVRLVIKTFPNPHNTVEADVAALMRRSPGTAPITIINRDLDQCALAQIYGDADVMVLPSRGEGYNLPALEAMLAGIPLIVTGYGGHLGFCGPEEARFIRYRFARASSHVSGGASLWIEPDEADLVVALREMVDPIQRSAVEERRARARDAALAASDPEPWLLHLHAFVSRLLDPPPPPPAVAWISTWQVKCGVAQYSDYLLGATSQSFRDNTIVLCDDRTAVSDQAVPRHKPVWVFGHHTDAAALVEAISAERVEAVVLQHQDGLISWKNLAIIARELQNRSIVTVVVLHNAGNLLRLWDGERNEVVAALGGIERVLVHNIEDLNGLVGLGLARNTTLFPHGAAKAAQAPPIRPLSATGAGPVIGCHGFFFAHKGIDKLIAAVAILRKTWPNVRLRLVNARFPDIISDRAISEAELLVRQLGLDRHIEWHTDFLPVETVGALLSGCDLLALPYDESADSASGAARLAMTSLVPTLATRVQIFAEFDGVMALVPSNAPAVLAAEIGALLASVDRRRLVQDAMATWLDQHDWSLVAGTLEGMVGGLVAEKHYRGEA